MNSDDQHPGGAGWPHGPVTGRMVETSLRSVETPGGDCVLVVLDPAQPDRTVRNVLRDVDLTDCDCHLLLSYPTAEYEARRQARIDAGVNGEYTMTHLADEAKATAATVGARWLHEAGGEFEAIGHVGRVRDAVYRATERHDYARIYLPRPRSSLWTRLLGTNRDRDTQRWKLPPLVQVVPVED